MLAVSRGVVDFQWVSLDPAPDGALAIELARGWYDVDTHRAVEVDHQRIRAVPVLGGVFFAWRTACSACAPGERERLHVVGPDTDGATLLRAPAFHVSLPLERSTAAGFRRFVSAGDLAEWERRVGMRMPRKAGAIVGFEATRAVDDREPLVIAYLAEVLP